MPFLIPFTSLHMLRSLHSWRIKFDLNQEIIRRRATKTTPKPKQKRRTTLATTSTTTTNVADVETSVEIDDENVAENFRTANFFLDVVTRAQCHKTFLLVIYDFSWQARVFVLGFSNKHSSLVRKLINYGQKKVYNIGLRCQRSDLKKNFFSSPLKRQNKLECLSLSSFSA
jgi:hypothetical protein